MVQTEDKFLSEVLERDIYPVLPDSIVKKFKDMKLYDLKNIEEIRIRSEKPLMIFKNGQDFFVNENSTLSAFSENAFLISKIDIDRTLQLMSSYSIYALEEELKNGFLTLRGGHRVGLAGRGVLEGSRIKTMKNISGMNIRIAREVKGCSMKLCRDVFLNGIKNTLIASPPGCGKTTLLRDLIRILSSGNSEIDIRGYKVGIVDERSEIAGCYMGVPQRDIGIRTDVLDACPKVQGITMLLRSMSPEIIAVDEIGSLQDAEAIDDAINSGVKVIATAHGRDMNEILRKNGVKRLIDNTAFERVVILSRKNGPGTIEEIISIN